MNGRFMKIFYLVCAIATLWLVAFNAQAAEQKEEDLTKKLANPVASLISISVDLYSKAWVSILRLP